VCSGSSSNNINVSVCVFVCVYVFSTFLYIESKFSCHFRCCADYKVSHLVVIVVVASFFLSFNLFSSFLLLPTICSVRLDGDYHSEFADEWSEV